MTGIRPYTARVDLSNCNHYNSSKMYLSVRTSETVDDSHSTIVPQLSVAFIGIFVILLVQAILYGIMKLKNWRKKDKTQPPTSGGQNPQTSRVRMTNMHSSNEQLPAYTGPQSPPPEYLERPPAAHVAP